MREQRQAEIAPGGSGLAANGNHFGDDGDGDFLGGKGSDVEAHGGVDPFEGGAGESFLFEFLDNADDLTLAADHGDVAGRGGDGPAEDAHVVLVAAGDDDEVAVRIDGEAGEEILVFAGEGFGGVGESFFVGEGFAVVGDGDVKAGDGTDTTEAFGDVASAEEEGFGLGDDGFDEDLQLAAADEAGIVRGVVRERELEALGFFGGDDVAGGVPNVGLDAAAADGAGERSVLADQHLGAFVTGDGSVDFDDGGEGALLAETAEANDLLEEVHQKTLSPVSRGERTAWYHPGKVVELSRFALIFDMDGVLVDSTEVHTQAWTAYLRGLGIAANGVLGRMLGKRNDEIVADLIGKDLPAEVVFEHGAAKERMYRQMMAPRLERYLVPGVREFLEATRGAKRAVASNAEPENIDFVLDGARLRPYFDAVVDGHQVVRPKPDPEVYLVAMARLGVTPAESIIIEDSMAGVTAARASGARVVGVETTMRPVAGVDVSVRDFHDPRLRDWLTSQGAW